MVASGLTIRTDGTKTWRGHLASSLTALRFSSRPLWAFMPVHVATPFADTILFTVSLLDELHIPYVAHYGTLLGAVRLGGIAPWDEDADLYILDGDLTSLANRLEPHLRAHGFESRMRVKGEALYVRRHPWLAGQGHIGISVLPAPHPDDARPSNPHWDACVSRAELHPIQRVPFYSSHLAGPAQPEPLLARLYGGDGSVAVMGRFRAPSISKTSLRFWTAARPFAGPTDWGTISGHFKLKSRTWSHGIAFPWWWFNGAYNMGIDRLRRLGHSLG